MEPLRSFEDLEYWKACRQLRLFVSREVAAHLPKDERFDLASQIRRAVRSTTANIAEGFGRFHYRDNYKFCSNARGSLFEILDHLITAKDDGCISESTLLEGRALFESAKRLVNGYMSYLQRAANDGENLREDSTAYRVTDELDPSPENDDECPAIITPNK